ncbi:hypothetical protein D3C81_1394680 [compost metagenome]
MYRGKASLAQQVDLVGNPAAFRADGQGNRLVQPAWARRVLAGMADQAKGALADGWQAVFDKRLEALLDDHFGQDGIAGLLKAEDQLFADGLGLKEWCLPEAFLDAVAVDQDHFRHAHGGDGLEYPAEHLWPWQGQHQGQRQLGRRRLVEADAELGLMAFQAQYRGLAHQPADTPDAQGIAHRHAVDFLHVGKTPVSQHRAIGRDEVGLFE